jgi:hypothetical protein
MPRAVDAAVQGGVLDGLAAHCKDSGDENALRPVVFAAEWR